jgi:hypothetical protein
MYIVQASLEPAKCKIGRTENLQRRLKENVLTGKSKDNHVYNQKRIGSSIKTFGLVKLSFATGMIRWIMTKSGPLSLPFTFCCKGLGKAVGVEPVLKSCWAD